MAARRSETLALVPIFASFDTEAIRRLDTRCIWRRVKAKETVVATEDDDRDVFFIVAGAVRVVVGAHTDVIFRDLQAGSFFGELAAIDGRPRSASVFAVTDAIVAQMPASVFLETVYGHADVCRQILLLLADRVRSLSERVDEFSHLPVRYRLCAELLRLSRPDRTDPGRLVVTPPPYHAELAARVSTRRETVARELKNLERNGLLARRTGALVLTDVPRLQRLVHDAKEAAEE